MRFVKRMLLVLLVWAGLVVGVLLFLGFCWLIHKGVEQFVPNNDNHWSQDAISSIIIAVLIFVPIIAWGTLEDEDRGKGSK